MSVRDEKGEKHPIRRDWFKLSIIIVYTVGFIGILGLFVYDINTLPNNPTNAATPQPPGGSVKPTLTTLVVEPIVSNPVIMSIIKHIFYLLVWIFLFLLFPVAFTRLKRFKLFNFEFEVEKQAENIINVLNVTTQKIYFLSKWATEEYANGFAEIAKNQNTIEEGISIVLKSLSDHYYENGDYVVEYRVYQEKQFKGDSKVPYVVRKSYSTAKSKMEAIPINKENKDQAYIKNYLLTVIEYEGNEYVVMLSSFDLEFDEYDAVLLSGLSALAIQYYERTEMLEILEAMEVDET